jgi:4-hydroxybutyrate dehydrogenase
MITQITRFSFPTQIVFGPGSIKELPREFAALGAAKPLMVTDSAMVKTAAFASILQVLENNDIPYEVFSGVQPNPHDIDVERGVASYTAAGCDLIVGVGGGSPMDAAKALAVLVGQGGAIEDYDAQSASPEPITGPLPPIVMIPTTAGTGSEVGKCAVITSTAQGRKIFLCNPLMMPSRAVLDPELTVSLPPHLTAATGMDALTHNIESLTAPIFHPMCDAIAMKGIELAVNYLSRAVEHPEDIEARGYMMLSAMMGAVAFQKDLGAAHSLSHALSAVCGLQHGMANAIVLPFVMDFNKTVCAKEYALIAREFGVPIHTMSEAEAAEAAVAKIRELNAKIGIPAALGSVGVTRQQLAEISSKAFRDPCHLTNARSCTHEDLEALLKQAL